MNIWRWIYKKFYDVLFAREKKYSTIGELLCYGISTYTNLGEVMYVFNKYLVRNYQQPNIVSETREIELKKTDMVLSLWSLSEKPDR